jgi:hypothetical protein
VICKGRPSSYKKVRVAKETSVFSERSCDLTGFLNINLYPVIYVLSHNSIKDMEYGFFNSIADILELLLSENL